MPTKEITAKSTMQEILEAYPGAQAALFARYHIGGCSSCGFEPTDTLEGVLRGKGVLDIQEALAFIQAQQEAEEKLQVSPRELAKLLGEGGVRLIDVRSEPEHGMVHLEGDLLAGEGLVQEILEQWPKDSPIVLYCHKGDKSPKAAGYLIGQGFTNVRFLRGGVDAWSEEIDPLLPRY